MAGLQILAEALILSISEQRSADRWHASQRKIHVHKGGIRVPGLRAGDRCGIARPLKQVIEFFVGDREPANRSVAKQRLPGFDGVPGLIDRAVDWLRGGIRGAPSQAARPCDFNCRLGHAVSDHHHRDRRAADDVDRHAVFLAWIENAPSDEAVDVTIDLSLGDAHQHDRLVMLDELRARDLAVEVDPDDDVDRLAGIAGRIDDVVREEGVADQLAALE